MLTVHLGDDFGHAVVLCVHGGDNIVPVVAGEGHEGVSTVYAFLQKHLVAGGVAADDVGAGDQVTEQIAALPVPVDDRDGNAAVQQKAGEVDRYSASAHDHYILHRAAVLADGHKKSSQLPGSAGNAEPVPCVEDKIAVGDQGVSAPLHHADKNLGAQLPGQLFQLHSIQLALLRDLVLDDLHAALGKGVHTDGAGEAQHTGDLLGTLILGIDNNGKAQNLPEKFGLTQILRVADTGDNMLRPQLPGGDAADHVHLVLFGGGHQQIGFRGAGLHKRFRVCGVAFNTDHVQVV